MSRLLLSPMSATPALPGAAPRSGRVRCGGCKGRFVKKEPKKNEAGSFSCHDLLHFRRGWESSLRSDPLEYRLGRHPAGSRASLPHVEDGFEVIPFSI